MGARRGRLRLERHFGLTQKEVFWEMKGRFTACEEEPKLVRRSLTSEFDIVLLRCGDVHYGEREVDGRHNRGGSPTMLRRKDRGSVEHN